MIDAVRAEHAFVAAVGAYERATEQRRVKFARAVDASGRGGQAELARLTGRSETAVKNAAVSGRRVLQELARAEGLAAPGDAPSDRNGLVRSAGVRAHT